MHHQQQASSEAAGTASLRSRLPLYEPRQRLPGYNCSVNVFITVQPTDAGKLVIRLFPDFDAGTHALHAEAHRRAAEATKRQYSDQVDAVFLRNLGRLPLIYDYKISAIWRDDFPEADKDLLRGLAHAATAHARVADAHAAAARSLGRRRVRH